MLIDTHCHLFKEYYNNLDELISLLNIYDVCLVINNGCDRKSNIEVLDYATKYESVYAALGIHPESVSAYNDEDIEFIKKHLSNPKVLAIGEIGLDYHYEGYDKEKQIELFEKQLTLAQEFEMPVIVHSRDATQDAIDTLSKYKVKGVIHSFSGSLEVAKQYINMGFMLGINGVVTFKNCKLIEVIKELGLNNIVLETDSPYLTPVPHRGTQNHPGHTKDIAQFIADSLNLSYEQVAEITSVNASRIFDI